MATAITAAGMKHGGVKPNISCRASGRLQTNRLRDVRTCRSFPEKCQESLQTHNSSPSRANKHGANLTVVHDALVQKLLHDLDGRVPVHRLLVLKEPVDELLGNKAVGVRAQVVPPVLDHLRLVEPQPSRRVNNGSPKVNNTFSNVRESDANQR